MSSVDERLAKLREERKAREEERIRKLRELNLKKYNNLQHSTAGANLDKSKIHLPGIARRSVSNLVPTYKTSTSKDVSSHNRSESTSNLKQPNGVEVNAKNSVNSRQLVITKQSMKFEKPPANSFKHLSQKGNNTSGQIRNKSNLNFPHPDLKKNINAVKKNNGNVNNTTKIPVSAPPPINLPSTSKVLSHSKSKIISNLKQSSVEVESKDSVPNADYVESQTSTLGNASDSLLQSSNNSDNIEHQPLTLVNAAENLAQCNNTEQNINVTKKTCNTNIRKVSSATNRKTLAPIASKSSLVSKLFTSSKSDNRKSLPPPKTTQTVGKNSPRRESVFDRLYKPKVIPKKTVDEAQRLRTDPSYLKKVIQNSQLTTQVRQSTSVAKPFRRSISAMHLKRVSEAKKCVHTWKSVGDKLDKVNINEIDEDDCIPCENVVSAVKSERKKVKFLTPISAKYNTPSTEELQSRLHNWLQKRGKSIDAYHHLQCFGISHLPKKLTTVEQPIVELYDDENKENIAVESDSDDQSYTENLNDQNDDFGDEHRDENGKDKWRRVSNVSESSLNESKNVTLSSGDFNHLDELLHGALNDLTELLREGFDWGQCACWLRAIRERFPYAPQTAAYWECRAALEERRGDLPASMQCWEEAIVMGTERSVVEENLDQLLDKFMQLKISPSSHHRQKVDPKMVDVKNVLKSTIIRFAVHKAKVRQSNQHEPAKYTVTPVRRSARLSVCGSAKRTPLQVCTTVSQASSLGHPVVFVPNEQLFETP